MNCSTRKHLQLSRVLFLFSVVLCQPIISARLNDPLHLPQVGKDLVDDSNEGFEETARGTQELKEPLKATDQVMTETHKVYHQDTTDYRAFNSTPPLQEQTFVHFTSVGPEPFTSTIPASPGEIESVRTRYPTDLFSMTDRRQGWIILHIFGMMYMFLSIVTVCDKFFVSALDVITEKLAIADDVTGATFMAAGVSAPKFLAILIGVFVTRSDVFFLGTVVFSSAFNTLFVIGMCALFSREVLHLTWWPLFRDISFFILCIIMIITFFLDSVIIWWESMLLLYCYAFYVFFMKFNMKIQQVLKIKFHKQRKNVEVISVQEQEKGCVSEDLNLQQGLSIALRDEDDNIEDAKDCVKNVNKSREEDRRDRPLSLDWPDTCLKQVTYLFLLPIIFPLWLTVPDVRNQKSRKFFVITFLVSILWIAVYSYFMVWWAHKVGETIGIPDVIMTSVATEVFGPGLISSVIVARKGQGDMAVTSSMGSNIFSITVCLPVSWLLSSAFYGFAPVPVNSSGLLCMVVLLILPLLYIIITITSCKWKVNKVLGLTMLLFYMTFQFVRVMFHYKYIVCPI